MKLTEQDKKDIALLKEAQDNMLRKEAKDTKTCWYCKTTKLGPQSGLCIKCGRFGI